MAFNTYGELRQQLATEGLTWTVNPNFSNDTVIVRPALGANLADWPQAASLPAVDVAALVAAAPTTNTLLRSHLVDRGFLAPIALGPQAVAGSPGPTAATGAIARAALSLRPLPHPPVTQLPKLQLTPPASTDWRSRFGWSWITEVRDQDPCEHCWVYASTALVEAMVRIEHCVWCLRSEGDYIEANKVPCGQCGNAAAVLSWVQTNGMADLDCVPWVDRDPGDRTGGYWNPAPGGCGGGSMQAPPAWAPPSNRNGRTVKIPAYTSLGTIADQKNWIDTVGPLVVGFEVYNDFFGWSGNTPYKKSSSAVDQGSHVMLAVGYDDGLGCWIVKNSWGTGWGNAGFGLIAYGQCNIDSNAKLGLRLTNPDPWTKRRGHSGGMIESGDGALHRNFEMLAPSNGNSFTHWWRDNSAATLPWAKAETLSSDVAHPPTFTATTYNRNFECVYPTTGSRLHHWWFDQSTGKWNDGVTFGPTNVAGPVGFVESSFGIGNFEVVAPIAGNQLEHWWRDSGGWHQGPTFAPNTKTMGPSLIQSTWNNLELVSVTTGGQLQHWSRHATINRAAITSLSATSNISATVNTWVASATFGSGIASPPCMIQGQYGMANEYGNGNFELCVALPNGTVQHWWRNNQDSALPWAMSASFGSGVATVVALLEGSYGFNLEVIVIRTDGNLQHYWRDGAGWHAGVVIGAT